MQPVPSLCGVVAVWLHILASFAHGQRQDGMSFTRHPQPLDAPLGDDVNFECNLNLPAERFAWRHRRLNSDKWLAVPHIPSNGGKTSRHVVNFDDESKAGDYRCIAFYGSSGLASDPARLTLATLQKFTDKSDVVIRVAAGNTVPITCPVPYSAPEAIIQFYKDNNPIQNVNGKTMVIENVKVSDSGSYHCSASNYITSQLFSSNHKTILNVHTNPTFQQPYFIKQPQTEYKVLRGKNVTLECFGVGYPVPSVTWSRLGSPLPANSIKTSMGLTIMNVQSADRGEYDCTWISNNNAHIKSVIILKVMEAPKVIKSPKESTFSEGGELELSCSVTGEPHPKVEWLINGESLLPNDNLEIKGSTLVISEVEKKHAGIVQCAASNEYGSDSGYNLLWVNPKQQIGTTESRPDYGVPNPRHKHTRGGGRRRIKDGKRKGTVLVPPNQPNVTRLSDASVMVRWSVPNNTGLPIQFFKVQYREFGQKVNLGKQGKWMTPNSEISRNVTTFEVPDLQPDHTYRFRIAAVYLNNDNKLSRNSDRFHLKKIGRLQRNKMPIPLLTNTKALSPHEVLLIWQNSDPSAEIDGFYVYHRASTTAEDYVKTTAEGKNSYNITISYLQPDTTYEFKVQSFSVDAASEFSKILRQKTKKVVIEHHENDNRNDHGGNLTLDSRVRPADDRNANMYAIIGGVLGGSTLLGGLTAVAVVYKRTKHKQSRESSQSEGKPITNGRVMNGGVTDSKMNITSNPLAGLDTSEDIIQPKSGQQSPMEMASFLNGQNNNSNNHNTSDTVGTDVNTSYTEPTLLQGSLPIEQPL
ncbi:interference hedgehog isoform X2 [Nomia melanderi]|uniref:interference hedgehog isoform X2 n=1 Tax=Nomia melanderi TaxID=2448451 RepID=UPI0013045CE9|nr:interference hedgehog-like isoform X2 [Nomia melanderi]